MGSHCKPRIACDKLEEAGQNPVYTLILRHSRLSRVGAEGEHVHHTGSPVIVMK
jgi:hypothetical protein